MEEKSRQTLRYNSHSRVYLEDQAEAETFSKITSGLTSSSSPSCLAISLGSRMLAHEFLFQVVFLGRLTLKRGHKKFKIGTGKEVSREKKVKVYLVNSYVWFRAGNCGRENWKGHYQLS